MTHAGGYRTFGQRDLEEHDDALAGLDDAIDDVRSRDSCELRGEVLGRIRRECLL